MGRLGRELSKFSKPKQLENSLSHGFPVRYAVQMFNFLEILDVPVVCVLECTDITVLWLP